MATYSHYEILDVPKTASYEEIRKAYRKAATKSHPDTGGNAALFGLVQEAWSVLGDTQKRAQYDREQTSRPSASSKSSTRSGTSGAKDGYNPKFTAEENAAYRERERRRQEYAEREARREAQRNLQDTLRRTAAAQEAEKQAALEEMESGYKRTNTILIVLAVTFFIAFQIFMYFASGQDPYTPNPDAPGAQLGWAFGHSFFPSIGILLFYGIWRFVLVYMIREPRNERFHSDWDKGIRPPKK